MTNNLKGRISSHNLISASEVMGMAEVYATTGTYQDFGFPVAGRLTEAARELVRGGLLIEIGAGRYWIAPTRDVIL